MTIKSTETRWGSLLAIYCIFSTELTNPTSPHGLHCALTIIRLTLQCRVYVNFMTVRAQMQSMQRCRVYQFCDLVCTQAYITLSFRRNVFPLITGVDLALEIDSLLPLPVVNHLRAGKFI